MSDNQIKITKEMEENTKEKNVNENKKRNKKHHFDDNFIDEDESEMDVIEYRKLLGSIFPSKFIKNKNKMGKKVQNIISKDIKKECSNKNKNKKEQNKKEQIKDKKIKNNLKEKYAKNNKLKEKYAKNKKEFSNIKLKKNEEDDDKSSEDDDDSEDIEDTESDEEESESDEEESESDEEYSESDEEDTESDSEEESDSDEKGTASETEEETDDDEDEDEDNHKSKKEKINIIFTIDDKYNGYENDDEYSDDCEDEETEDEDESVSSDEEDEKIHTRRRHSKINGKNEKNKNKKSLKNKDIQDETDPVVNIVEIKPNFKKENENDEEVLKQLKEIYIKNKCKMIEKCIKTCEDKIMVNNKKIDKKNKKQKAKNGRIYKRIIRDKNTMNDFAFFEKMDQTDQIKIIKEIREINKIIRIEKPYRITLLESNIPANFKAAAIKKINSLKYLEPGSGEYYKIQNWVDTFMSIPFNNYEKLPVNISDGVEACHNFMEKAQATLESAVYGLNDAKMQIMQMLGQLVTNPTAMGCAIAIKGPMGTGKTTLVKEGISKILNRPFAFISLGGATDSSFLEGHSYTYEGSVWGKIVQILIDSKCMNPVIYFDELDKISDTPKGEEIAGILTHLTDTTQNSQFHDKYFVEIDFDLSKCLFIFSYNDESKVNPILRDRMYRIQTKGYDKKQKTFISSDYLLPKIRDQIKFTNEDIIIPDESLHYIIDTHCEKEDGVRNLKRCLEIIYTKLNLYRLMKPESNLFEKEMSIKVEFPFTVTKLIVDKLIKKEADDCMAMRGMYV